MNLRRIIFWLFTLLLLAAVGVGSYGYYLWNNQEQLLEDMLRKQIAQQTPGWDIRFERANFDWDRKLKLYGLQIGIPDGKEELVHVPEVTISIDRRLYEEDNRIEIQKVKLLKPEVHLKRDYLGQWNWQKLPPLPESDGTGTAPEIVLQEAITHLTLEMSQDAQPIEMTLKGCNLRLLPSGEKRYHLEGQIPVDESGTLTVKGHWNQHSQAWNLTGQLNNSISSDELMNLAGKTSDELRQRLTDLEARMQEIKQTRGQSPPPLPGDPRMGGVSHPGTETALRTDTLGLGLTGQVAISFRLAQWRAGGPLEYKLLAQFEQGQIENPLLPFPLHNVSGKCYWDNRQLILHQISADHGDTKLNLNGRFLKQTGQFPGRLAVNAKNLRLNDDLRARLPENIVKFYDQLSPTGDVDVSGDFQFDGQQWKPTDFALTARNCEVHPEQFSYPIKRLSGTVRQQGQQLTLNFTGEASDHPLRLQGTILNPGPEMELGLTLSINDLPFDESLWSALPKGVYNGIAPLRPEGQGDVFYRMVRRAGPDQPLTHELGVTLENCTVNHKAFPYRLEQLNGKIAWSSQTGRATFSELTARNGTARITGSGWYQEPGQQPARVLLNLTTTDGRFNDELRQALPTNLQQLWKDLAPSGKLDLGVQIGWTDGQPVTINLPSIEIKDAAVNYTKFPWPMDQIHAQLSWQQGLLTIQHFAAMHEETRVKCKGFYKVETNGDWRVRINDALVDDLVPDRLFRRAMPAAVRSGIDKVNPRGKPLSLAGMIELRGTNDPKIPMTAAWDVQCVMNNTTLTLGIDVSNLRGPFTSRGTWNGRELDMKGELDFDTLTVKEHQLAEVKGPYRVAEGHLLIGSSKILKSENYQQQKEYVPIEERVRAKAIGGVITLDAFAKFGEQLEYRVKTTLTQGRLEEYSRLYLPRVKNISGVMNGWIDLWGRGTSTAAINGLGQMQISPAALYELPLVLRTFQALSPRQQDKTAFRYAFADFTIGRNQFVFNVIDLVGNSVSLRGRGWIAFDTRLAINFYSMMSQGRSRIPLLGDLAKQVTTGWVGVEVRGRLGDPTAKIRAVPVLDDAMRGFLGAFGPTGPTLIPRLATPPLTPQQINRTRR